ncbi:MAG: hypothetical protein RLY31_1660, partial [Bacteroidota bacterium]
MFKAPSYVRKLLKWSVCLLLADGWSQELPVATLIGVEEGLSQGFVTSIVRDDKGLIWLGTVNGLNKYDGRHFECFRRGRSARADSTSLNNNQVTAICGKGDHLFLGYGRGGGWSIFDKRTRRNRPIPICTPPFYSSLDIEGLNLATQNITEDAYGQYWIALTGGGYDFYVVRLTLPDEWLGGGAAGEAGVYGKGWALDWWQFTPTKNPALDLSVDGKHVAVRLDDKVIGMPVQGQFGWRTHWKVQPSQLPLTQCATSSIDFFLDQDGNLLPFGDAAEGREFDWERWLPENTLVALRRKEDLAVAQMRYAGDRESLLDPIWTRKDNDGVFRYLFDHMGNIWLHHSANGVLVISHRTGVFKTAFRGESVGQPILGTPDGNICWLQLGGLKSLDNRDEWLLEALRSALRTEGSPYFRRLEAAPNGEYWVLKGGEPSGLTLTRIDALRRTVRTYNLPLPYERIAGFGIDAHGEVYIPSDGMLIHFESSTGCWETVPTDMLAQGATMYSVDFTADGAVWLAMEKGLGLYWPGSGRVQPITGGYGAGDMGLLDGYPVNDVQTDPIDSFLLWIGTSGGGLFRLDVRNGSVTEAMAGVIQDGIVYCILPGTAGKLWLSTNFGLYEYDPFSGTHRNFGRRDGLQGAEFNTWASGIRKVRSRDGWSEELMFGGVAGLNHFDPAQLQVQHAGFDMNINILEVNEEEIKVGDKSGILSAAVEYLPPVCLPFEKNNIRISYS